MKVHKISPQRASNGQICQMKRDHTEFKDLRLMTDGYTVWLVQQKAGESPTQSFSLRKGAFNRLLRWYLRESKLKVKP